MINKLSLGQKVIVFNDSGEAVECSIIKLNEYGAGQSPSLETTNSDKVAKNVVDFTAQDSTGALYKVFDALGKTRDYWCVQSICCEQCAYAQISEGDRVPYGSDWATLPGSIECDCPSMPEDNDNPCDYTENGSLCTHFKQSIPATNNLGR